MYKRKPIIDNNSDDFNHDVSNADSNSENNISDKDVLNNKTNTIDKFKKVKILLDEVMDLIKYSFYNIKSLVIINGFIKAGFVDGDKKLTKKIDTLMNPEI